MNESIGVRSFIVLDVHRRRWRIGETVASRERARQARRTPRRSQRAVHTRATGERAKHDDG